MAKISARGDRERARYTTPTGTVYVHTQSGRLLRKAPGSSGYTLAARRVSEAYVSKAVTDWGWVRA